MGSARIIPFPRRTEVLHLLPQREQLPRRLERARRHPLALARDEGGVLAVVRLGGRALHLGGAPLKLGLRLLPFHGEIPRLGQVRRLRLPLLRVLRRRHLLEAAPLLALVRRRAAHRRVVRELDVADADPNLRTSSSTRQRPPRTDIAAGAAPAATPSFDSDCRTSPKDLRSKNSWPPGSVSSTSHFARPGAHSPLARTACTSAFREHVARPSVHSSEKVARARSPSSSSNSWISGDGGASSAASSSGGTDASPCCRMCCTSGPEPSISGLQMKRPSVRAEMRRAASESTGEARGARRIEGREEEERICVDAAKKSALAAALTARCLEQGVCCRSARSSLR